MSRWTIPWACAWASASHTCAPSATISRASSIRSRRRGVPCDELHHEERDPAILADVVHGHDVRMVERRSRARFLQQANASILRRRRLGQHLDGDLSIELEVGAAVDDAHAAAAELGIEPVAAVQHGALPQPHGPRDAFEQARLDLVV